MTINDQIRDEKIQYDIHSEAAKISGLSSGKIRKYEYLTGEGLLPSNQQQIIKQAKFTYSHLGKAFEKQIKAIEDQGQIQIDALKVLEPKAIERGSNNIKPVITQETYDKILEQRMDEILKMSDKIDFDRLIYNFKGPTTSINFGKFGGPIYICGHMKNGGTTLQQVEKQQKGNPKHKSSSQLYVIENVKNLYNSIQIIIDLLNDNSRIRSESIYKSKQNETKEKGLKILTR